MKLFARLVPGLLGFQGALIALLALSAMFGVATAADELQQSPAQTSAQQTPPPGSLVGKWMAAGKDPSKIKFAKTLYFTPNGKVMLEWAVSNDKAGGVARCKGSYRFDGSSLSAQYSACASCVGSQCAPYPAAVGMLSASGPIQFQGPAGSSFHWGDLTYLRQ